jgi:hypothetical protein
VIPYVAAWSSEEPAEVRPEPLVEGRPAIFSSGAHGDGRPVLGKLHEGRQRECVVRRLCQVCRTPIPHGGIAMGSHEWTSWKGRRVPLYTEPPACLACAALALSHCPGLRRAQASGAFPVYRVRGYELVAQLVGRNFAQALQEQIPAGGAVGYVKAALTRYVATSPASIAAAAARVRR